MELMNRIVLNPDVLAGKPVIAGTRLSVQFIVGLLAKGMTNQDILNEYPYIEQDDIQACLLYASKSLDSSLFVPLAA
ncbi:DUF433 domain-containing protein [uncultured Spirosoma sp.]|uniref:DUF433 domain-containing protein n=1 Tax=uncultured Spirosoma sp. TaxID=278208 RepID=UPI00258F96FA|nr:DUF433 domain-containing protein [uncultured Spirosoma sp.]